MTSSLPFCVSGWRRRWMRSLGWKMRSVMMIWDSWSTSHRYVCWSYGGSIFRVKRNMIHDSFIHWLFNRCMYLHIRNDSIIHLWFCMFHLLFSFLTLPSPQVLKETLRIYPTAPGTSREIKDDIVIQGIHIPAGVICFVSHFRLPVFVPLNWEMFLLQIHKG